MSSIHSLPGVRLIGPGPMDGNDTSTNICTHRGIKASVTPLRMPHSDLLWPFVCTRVDYTHYPTNALSKSMCVARSAVAWPSSDRCDLGTHNDLQPCQAQSSQSECTVLLSWECVTSLRWSGYITDGSNLLLIEFSRLAIIVKRALDMYLRGIRRQLFAA